MDRDLTSEEKMLQATREAAQREREQRINSESELSVLHKVVSEYIFHNNVYDKILNDAINRAKEYLKKIGVITR